MPPFMRTRNTLFKWVCLAIPILCACQPLSLGASQKSPASFTDSPGLTGFASVETPTAPSPTRSAAAVVPTAAIPVGGETPTGKIVFTCQPGSFRQLCLIPAMGGEVQILTDQPAHDQEASFSSDGERLVFISDLDGYPEVYLRNLKSGEERRLTERIGQVRYPRLSPDGGRVAFSRTGVGEDWSTWIMLTQDSLARPLGAFPGQALAPAWSPDGQWLAFRGRTQGADDLYLLSLETGEVRRLTHLSWEINAGPDWSPDGNWLVFSAGRRNERDIYLLALQDGAPRRLTYGGNNSWPAFSPDGGWIAFSSSRDGDHEIFTMRADGSRVTQLTDNNFDDWQPNWGQ